MHHPNRRPFADPLDLLPRGLTELYSVWVSLTYPFASKGRSVVFILRVSWTDNGLRISLGNSVSLRRTRGSTSPPRIPQVSP